MSGKNIGMIIGIVLVILGVLGFINGGMGIVGAEGFFVTNMAHDVVHLVVGLVLVWAAMKSVGSLGMLFKVFGIILVIVAILGFMGDGMILGFLESNMNSDVLHLIVGLLFLWAGFKGGRSNSMMSSGM